VTLNVVFRAAKSGMITGTLLGRGSHQRRNRARLLFTALLNSPFWPESLGQPMAK
jgi:ABC-type phosphate transport system permease subunit